MCADQPGVEALLREWIEALTLRSMRALRSYVRATGLSMAQFVVLSSLYHGGSCGVSDVGQHLDVSGAAASQLTERLVQAGLVERSEHPADRRVRLVDLTPKGRTLVAQGIAELHLWLDQLVSQLDEEQVQAVLNALPHLIEAERSLRTSAPRS